MDKVAVTYNGTKLLEVRDNISHDAQLEAEHFLYVSPLLEDIDIHNKRVKFVVATTSQFESGRLPYVLTSSSEFILERFTVCEDKLEILGDCVQTAFRKHIEILKENLNNFNYLSKVRSSLEPRIYKDSLITILHLATIYN